MPLMGTGVFADLLRLETGRVPSPLVAPVLGVPQQHPARSMVDVPHPDRRVLVQLVSVDLRATTPGQQLEAVVVRRDLRRCPLGGAPPRPEELWRDGSRVSIGGRDRDSIAARGLLAQRVAGDDHAVPAQDRAKNLHRILGAPQRAPRSRFVGRADVARRQTHQWLVRLVGQSTGRKTITLE